MDVFGQRMAWDKATRAPEHGAGLTHFQCPAGSEADRRRPPADGGCDRVPTSLWPPCFGCPALRPGIKIRPLMADLDRLASPGSEEERLLRQVDLARLPRHVA